MIEPELKVFEKEIQLRHPKDFYPQVRSVIGRFGIEVYTSPYQYLTCTPEQIEAWVAALKALAAKARAMGQRALATESTEVTENRE